MNRRKFIGGLVTLGPLIIIKPAKADLFLNELSGFGVGRSDTVQTLFDRTTGSNIGGMTNNGGLASAYDGVTSQAAAASATSVLQVSGFDVIHSVGKTWTSPKIISGVKAWSPNNQPFRPDNPVNLPWQVTGSNDGFATAGVIVGSGTMSGTGSSQTLTKLTGFTTSAAYSSHLFMLQGNGANNTFLSELQFFEEV